MRLSEFLKMHNAYDKFVANFNKTFSANYRARGSGSAISSAFSWSRSPEHSGLWRRLHYLWLWESGRYNDTLWLLDEHPFDYI